MSEIKTEGSFKIKAPEKKEPVAEQVKEAPEEVKAEPQPKIDSPVSIDEESGGIKLDLTQLNKPQEDANTEQETTDVASDQQAEPVQEVEKEVPQQPEPVQAEESVLEEITDEEVEEKTEELKEEIEQAVQQSQDTAEPLPENIQKVVEFMQETGGSLEDYVKLNQDYSSLNENQLLREYYENTRPHLDKEDIDFLMEDKFSYDEEVDDEREIRRKKISQREELAKAKNHLDGLKSKYYKEIKSGSKLAPEQQKAVDFFNRYTKENEEATRVAEKQTEVFLNKTSNVFGDDFKGFDYQVGDKKYRFKVKDANSIKENQSDINNFVKKFLNEKNEMSDAKGYHKGLFTAMNADSIANHFYEQGKADAMKDSMAKSKNVQMGARGVHQEVKTANGFTVRSVDSGSADSKLRIKTFKHLK
tara:strand:+ start:1490 stop:2740 length:1251 start_codon:yes stop_codon:yes gene_type:complete